MHKQKDTDLSILSCVNGTQVGVESPDVVQYTRLLKLDVGYDVVSASLVVFPETPTSVSSHRHIIITVCL